MSTLHHVRGLIAACLVVSLCAACGGDPSRPRLEGPLPALLEVEITGHDFSWRVRYPGVDGRLGTEDDILGARDLYLPADWPVRIHLRSEDYVYTLRIPPLGAEEIAVPDLEFAMDLGAVSAGVYPLRGDQMCGYSHANLIGRMIVDSPVAYWRAISEMSTQ